jgi:hypothetical protein
MPDSLSNESVRQFACQFERSFVVRRTYLGQEWVTPASVYVDNESTEMSQSDDEWVVRFQVAGPTVWYRREDSTETSHVDPQSDSSSYLVLDHELDQIVPLNNRLRKVFTRIISSQSSDPIEQMLL